MKKVLLTGASGFIGNRFLEYSSKKYQLLPFSVKESMLTVRDLEGVNTVLHMGGLAHQDKKQDPKKYFDSNFEKTKLLADKAKSANVEHFIFLSTIKVYGDSHATIITKETICNPQNDSYGESKLLAEKYLNSISDKNFLVTIIRTPLVYGPGVKGNLYKLLKLCDTNYYLPFGAIKNRRTMIFLDNLIDFINYVIDNQIGGLFLVGDEKVMSIDFLVKSIRKHLERPARIITLPPLLKSGLLKLFPSYESRLFGSLEVDSKSSYDEINFKSKYSVEMGIKTMVDSYIGEKK